MSKLRGLALAIGTVERPAFKGANEPVIARNSERLASEVERVAHPLNALRSGRRLPGHLGTAPPSV